MSQTLKIRKGPSKSALLFSIGTVKKGNDGNMWSVIKTKNGVHRWSRIVNNKNTKTIKKSKKGNNDVSLDELIKLGNKYNISTSNLSKKELALRIFNLRSSGLSTNELEKIAPLLPNKEHKHALNMVESRIKNPVSDFKGMWKPAPETLHSMTREQMIKQLRGFRDAWEKQTTRNEDLPDERLMNETREHLLDHLKWYYSEEAKHQAETWLFNNV